MITHVVGTTFKNEEYGVNRQEIIKKLSGKEKIFLRREPKNRFDKNAVAVMLWGEKPQRIGFIKAELAGFLAEMWNDWKFFTHISEIRDGDEEQEIPWGISIEIKKTKKKKNYRKNFQRGNKKGQIFGIGEK